MFLTGARGGFTLPAASGEGLSMLYVDRDKYGYQAALPHRINAADYRAFIVEGI